MKEFTVKDLAEILGVSKPTVQRAINAAEIEANREDKQTRYYDLDTAAAISLKVKPDFDFFACAGCFDTPPNELKQTETPPHGTATTPNQPETELKQTETPSQNENVEFMRAMLSTIQEQLAAKDKQIAAYEAQIAVKDEQIKEYSELLKEAMLLTKGQQYIAAADKTAGLLEAAANEEDENTIAISVDKEETAAPQEKKSFWKSLFGLFGKE